MKVLRDKFPKLVLWSHWHSATFWTAVTFATTIMVGVADPDINIVVGLLVGFCTCTSSCICFSTASVSA